MRGHHRLGRSSGDGLLKLVRKAAGERYDEGYERGLHDADAAEILRALLSLVSTAGKLRYSPRVRSMAAFYWASITDDDVRDLVARRARSLGRLLAAFTHSPAVAEFAEELGRAIGESLERSGLELAPTLAELALAGDYLAEELRAVKAVFTCSGDAARLRDGLLKFLADGSQLSAFETDMADLAMHPARRFELAEAWLRAYVASDESLRSLQRSIVEAVALLVTSDELTWETSSARTSVEVSGLLGQHANLSERKMTLRLDEFLARLNWFAGHIVPGYREYRSVLQTVLDDTRSRLRIDEFLPRVLSSFVRNRLINEVYLPEFGKNLAKQLGAAGEKKRTDLMGLLLLISPPGYGKTTLMEYIASRLGLVFMKVNGPALGHEVHSLDPSEAPNATARQEVEKINLALEMGNNVMLYLDDIQHTHPELLQKFISLCDAQRRIEGIWRGKTRTYDLRGKKFCVVMAGNPYTESGDKFQIPDMLANRADAYNPGDMLDGSEEVFALSYIENAMTSNDVLAPLAAREQDDIYKIIRIAKGEQMASTELSHAYSSVELN